MCAYTLIYIIYTYIYILYTRHDYKIINIGLAYSLLRGCHRGGLTDGVGAAAEYWGGGRGGSCINNLIGVTYMIVYNFYVYT